MAQLPADRTKLALAQSNQIPGAVASSTKNIQAMSELYDTTDLLYNFTTGLISAGTLSRLGVINVRDYNASGSAQTTTGSITQGTNRVALASIIDFAVGHGIWLEGIHEVASLTITNGASSSANCTVTLNGVSTTVALTSGDSASDVATDIRAASFDGWTTGGSGATVTFMSDTSGVKTDATYSAGTTGATGTMTTTTQGTADIVSTISAITNNVVTIGVNAPTNMANVNVRHDDTQAIQTAINYAISLGKREIVFPYGTYNYGTLTDADEVTAIGDGVTLIGDTPILLTSLAALSAETVTGAVNAVTGYSADPSGSASSSAAIQAAVDKAHSLYKLSNTVGGSLYYTANVKVIIPQGFYKITAKITVPTGVDLEMDGAVLIAYPADKSIDCFDITGSAFRNVYSGGVFVGFRTAFIISTNNLDTSKMDFRGQYFHMCSKGIDTVSYTASRSTMLTIDKFISWKTDVFAKVHCDSVHIKDGWITHTGYNGAAIYNQGFTKMEGVVCVPTPGGTSSRWIDNYSEDAGSTTILGQRGLHIDHCRFGAEAGSMPIVYNYAAGITGYSSFVPTNIVIENTFAAATGQTIDALIVLFAMPNRIELRNMSGMTNLANGLIHCDSSFDPATITIGRLYSIELDNSCYYHPTSFPLMDASLYRFLKTKENLNTSFRQTFTGGKTHLQYVPVDAGTDSGTGRPMSSIIVPVNTPTTDALAYAQNFGLGFLMIVDAYDSQSGTYSYMSNAIFYVACTGGFSSQKIKRLNATRLASFAGGASFAAETDIKEVLWATTLNKDVPIGNQEDVLVKFFGTPAQCRVTVIPVFGVSGEVS